MIFEKARKAIRPLFQTTARFNLPVETSLRIFHAYIEPIALYNEENWTALADKQIEKFHTGYLTPDNWNRKSWLDSSKIFEIYTGYIVILPKDGYVRWY